MNQTPKNLYTIPVYPHVKKFMQKNPRMPRTPQGHYLCEDVSDLGVYVTRCLTHARSWKNMNDQVRNRAVSSIKIILTTEQMKHGPRLIKFSRLILDTDKLFKSALIHWIIGRQAAGVPVLTSCKDFLTHYTIDESEYSVDNCYKVWQRSARGEEEII